MNLYVTVEDLYPHKLATILGRGKRLERILKVYPTERRFKAASIEEIGQVIGIKNPDSKIMRQLATLDETYNELITPKYRSDLSIAPYAKTIMGIDTEYLLSPLDSIQFVIYQNNSFYSGFIFTNPKLAKAVSPKEGIKLLRRVIEDFKPDVIVGHNFNCDISVLERVYQDQIPELHKYDDTMKMARKSHVANIVGSAALKKLIQKLFDIKVIEVYKAYKDLTIFIEYGLMDALFPIYLRYFLMTGRKPEFKKPEKIDYLILPENEIELKYKKIHFPEE
ncbi:hypothetical protein BBF96_14875 [Anoxybacter fermentans]|uniref:DNA-directed DNA polymerase family B exonuclease domain-containing protein n=1 Tax=Anoxybacter fermentans TaxID=1323375 RepID=A0A3S9T206_9FIRM|nr:hypothetical protein [Anoxybacter fermentans]AZR74557.1 hypothetical protein BBF96_14875 [Anoxybacter fermentans]